MSLEGGDQIMRHIISDPAGWGRGIARQSSLWGAFTLVLMLTTVFVWSSSGQGTNPAREPASLFILIMASGVWPLFLLRGLSAVARSKS